MSSPATQGSPPTTDSGFADQKLPQVKAEVLRDRILATPGLSSLDPNATLGVFAAALLAESDDGYTRDQALGILQRARKISLEDLITAVQQVTAQMADAMTAFWAGFIQQTWESTSPPPQYVDPAVVAKRKEQEEQEQEQNHKLALQYVDNAQVALTALGIEEKELPPPKDSPKKPGFKLDLGKMVHGLIYKQEPAPAAPEKSGPPGWLTPPLLDKQSEDVTVFDNDIMDIVGTRKLSGEQAWNKLDERGYDRPRIVQTIDKVRKTAQEQIAQCDQILAFIRTDYQTHIEPVVKAAVLLGHAISVVNSFYLPPAPRPGSPNLGARPNPTAPRPRGR